MPVTAGKNNEEISQREQYAKGGFGRKYWDYRDAMTLKHVIGPRVLDAGCGEGITLEKLTALFPQAEGVDIDPENIAICQQQKLNVAKADLTNLPFEDKSFDSIVFMEVIEHLAAPQPVLNELARVMRPGGRMIIVYPIDWAMWLARMFCLRWREASFDPGHVRQWNARSLRNALHHAGFSSCRAWGIPLPWPCALHGLVVAERTST